jgi:hypothetical protein
MEAINSFCIHVAKENTEVTERDDGSEAEQSPPTAEEISRLTFAKLRDLRIHAQELRNQFARLLNRGSSLE